MTQVVNVREAKTHLSRLLETVERGEDVVIARSGKPVARLVPARSHGPRRPGAWKGRVVIADDFDEASELGRPTVPDGLGEELQRQGFVELPVTVEDGLAGASPRHHEDPFDRMLIAQATRRGLQLLSVDRHVDDYDVRLL